MYIYKIHIQTICLAGSTFLRENAWKKKMKHFSYRPTQPKNLGSVKGKQSIFNLGLGKGQTKYFLI